MTLQSLFTKLIEYSTSWGLLGMIKPKFIQDDAHTIVPKLKFSAAEFADTTFQALADKIAWDYTYIVKKKIIPQLGDLGRLKLRELRILTSVYFYTEPLSPHEISEILRYDPATVTRALGLLEESGMVEKVKREYDLRAFDIKVTDAGSVLARRYVKEIQTVFDTIESRLTVDLDDEDKTILLNAMLKVSRRAEAMKAISHNLKP